MISAADPAASHLFGYDQLDRRTSVTHDLAGLSFNVDLLSAYNTEGDRSQLKAMLGGVTDFVNDFTFDDLHRMTQIQQHGVWGGEMQRGRSSFPTWV